MTVANTAVFTTETVEISWREWPHGPTVTAACVFNAETISHVIGKHVIGKNGGQGEPWQRILNASHVDRLTEAARRRSLPQEADCRDFVRLLTQAIRRSSDRPLFCAFLEMSLHEFDRHGTLQQNLHLVRREKVMFVLDSGAVAFFELNGPRSALPRQASFRTAFFPRPKGWVSPKRAAAATAARYVIRWAEHEHHTGGRLLPKPLDGVRERDDETGMEKQREFFRFTTPEEWGFERQDDGEWVWFQ